MPRLSASCRASSFLPGSLPLSRGFRFLQTSPLQSCIPDRTVIRSITGKVPVPPRYFVLFSVRRFARLLPVQTVSVGFCFPKQLSVFFSAFLSGRDTVPYTIIGRVMYTRITGSFDMTARQYLRESAEKHLFADRIIHLSFDFVFTH